MLNFFIDFIYVLAGLSAILSYKYNGIEQLALVATAYAFIAISFQFFVHIFDAFTNKFKSKKDKLFVFNIGIVVLSMILSLTITQLFIPIPYPTK